MKIVEIHRVLSFDQFAFLKQFIVHCTAKRAAAKTDFHRSLWKTYINSTFGKFIEQTRNRLHCVIARKPEIFSKWCSSPRYRSNKIISETMVIIFLSAAKVRMDKAYAVGFTILERSKQFMYDQYYNQIKPRLGDVEVCFSDTDSFLIAVKTPKKTDNISKLADIMDFSNYPPSHPKHSTKNKNALGFFKDEMKGSAIDEFVGLRSKTYAISIPGMSSQTRCKGVKKGYRKTIPFEAFKRCLDVVTSVRVTQYNITSKNHLLETTRIDKLAFGSFDDKRFILNCGLHSVPYGSWQAKRQCVYCMIRHE